jgi:hypothetical protein
VEEGDSKKSDLSRREHTSLQSQNGLRKLRNGDSGLRLLDWCRCCYRGILVMPTWQSSVLDGFSRSKSLTRFVILSTPPDSM